MIFRDLKKTYGIKTALDIPELLLEDGKIYAVIGANGCGKSTLAKLLSGTVKSDGEHIKCPDKRIGYMPQKSYAFNMSMRKNLRINGNGKDSDMREKELMDALKIEPLADTKARKLSGGETAKMALARLLMSDYGFLILDEPTAAMDMESTLLAEKLITEYLEKNGCAVLLITHSLSQARRLADYVLFISDGKLVEYGSSDDILSSPQDERTKEFLEFSNI